MNANGVLLLYIIPMLVASGNVVMRSMVVLVGTSGVLGVFDYK